MDFKQWLNEAWVVGEPSRKAIKRWKEIVKIDSVFMKLDWREVLKILEKSGEYKKYRELACKSQGLPDDMPDSYMKEWAAKEYIKVNSNVILARVDPCKIMTARTIGVSQPDSRQIDVFKKLYTEKDIDVGDLPLAFVTYKGVNLYDGNHRMSAACELGQDGYLAIAYFMNYDAIKSAVKEIIE